MLRAGPRRATGGILRCLAAALLFSVPWLAPDHALAAVPAAEAEPDGEAAGPAGRLAEVAEVVGALRHGDPLERVNRLTYDFNLRVERLALDPLYRFYVQALPPPLQRGAYNFFQNLQEPVVAASAGLEGDFENAGLASLRFAVNSTAGVLGLMDVARHFRLRSRKTDLSATLCRYGVPGGPYLVLPVLGPSSARDLVGRMATNLTIYAALGSLFYPYYSGKLLTEYVDERPELDMAMAGSIDPYVRNRAIFRQREAERCREETPEAADYPLLGTEGD